MASTPAFIADIILPVYDETKKKVERQVCLSGAAGNGCHGPHPNAASAGDETSDSWQDGGTEPQPAYPGPVATTMKTPGKTAFLLSWHYKLNWKASAQSSTAGYGVPAKDLD